MPGSRHAAVEAPGDALPQRLAVPSREFLTVGLLDAVIALLFLSVFSSYICSAISDMNS